MRLIDRDDFDALDPVSRAIEVVTNADGTRDPGPYLWCVNDQGAWVGRLVTDRGPGYSVFSTGQIHVDTVKRDNRWKRSIHLWVKEEPIGVRDLVGRYRSISQRLKKTPRVWALWDDVYHWKEASDLLWDGLAVHRTIERREHEGQRQVRNK